MAKLSRAPRRFQALDTTCHVLHNASRTRLRSQELFNALWTADGRTKLRAKPLQGLRSSHFGVTGGGGEGGGGEGRSGAGDAGDGDNSRYVRVVAGPFSASGRREFQLDIIPDCDVYLHRLYGPMRPWPPVNLCICGGDHPSPQPRLFSFRAACQVDPGLCKRGRLPPVLAPRGGRRPERPPPRQRHASARLAAYPRFRPSRIRDRGAGNGRRWPHRAGARNRKKSCCARCCGG